MQMVDIHALEARFFEGSNPFGCICIRGGMEYTPEWESGEDYIFLQVRVLSGALMPD